VAAETGHPTQLQAHRLAFGRGLDSGDERCLAGGTAASLAARAFAAEVGIVEFDPPGQLPGSVTLHHHLRQLVLDFPGCGLGHAKAAAQFDAGNALLADNDIKAAAGVIFDILRKKLRVSRGGNDPKAFMRNTLARLIRPGMAVYGELKTSVFGP
jgi:hypothetical protein